MYYFSNQQSKQSQSSSISKNLKREKKDAAVGEFLTPLFKRALFPSTEHTRKGFDVCVVSHVVLLCYQHLMMMPHAID